MMYLRCCQLWFLVAMVSAYYYPRNHSPYDRSYGFGKELNDYLEQDSPASDYYQRSKSEGNDDQEQLDEMFENTVSADMENSPAGSEFQNYHQKVVGDEIYSDSGVTTHIANWWNTFDNGGWSRCSAGTYLTGLWRSGQPTGFFASEHDGLGRLEEGECKTAPSSLVGSSKKQQCYKLNIYLSFDHKGWAQCKTGYFIKSIFSTKGSSLYNIEELQCCKPETDKVVQGTCHDEDVVNTFDHKGWSRCTAGTYMAGMWRNSCNSLHCIEKFKCCEMEKAVVSTVKPQVSPVKPQGKGIWVLTFGSGSWSKCPVGMYMSGFWKGAGVFSDQLGQCKSTPSNWATLGQQQCYKTTSGYVKCRSGYYMVGMHATATGEQKILNEIECCRPLTKSVVRGECYKKDVSKYSDEKDLSKCKEGTYMAGLALTRCYSLYCVETIVCCEMKHV